MQKKLTKKEQKIAAEKAALRARITDMLLGLSGSLMCTRPQSASSGPRNSSATQRSDFTDLPHFDTINKATEYLYDKGFRA